MQALHPRVRPLRRALLAAASALTFSAGSAAAAEIATDPGDYAALPAGANLALLYGQHTERNANYANGNRTAGDFRLVTDIGLARFVHFMQVGDYTIDPQIIIPFGKVDLQTAFGPLKPVSASGVGDPLVGGTLWLLNQQQQQRWLGVSAFVAVPAGNYDGSKGPVNVGENRWKGIFQLGYVTALPANFMLDVIGEYAVYGDNTNFLGLKREQDASYGLQTHLRYMFSPTTSLALSWYQDFGGATKLNGVAQNDRMNNGRLQAGFSTFVAPTVQLMVQYGQSIQVENGAKESNRINLRIAKVF
ncbi:transporter [Herbaspirillum huttiense]|uniref:transporter n=1 Tax=Herbaspirillum huttiense TaxID=863372 RepID=UPI001065F21C|nr:transporter [Herbaspirillum huttiense]QBP74685.1 transporter [Herbaspirillum huttiense]